MNEPAPVQANIRRPLLPRIRARIARLAPFTAGVLATFAGLLVYGALFPPPQPLTAREINQLVVQTMASATPAPAYAASAYAIIQPSLVLIQTESPAAGGQVAYGVGSGVVVSDRGDILTSLHVVADATSIELTFADGTQSSGLIIAAEPEHDIAVLRARRPPAQLIPATLGNPNGLRIGDEAFVVGHPLGLYGSASAGVISGFDRSFQPEHSDRPIEGLIQVDAAVNPGSSGGPLLNRSGQVVGIVTGLVNPTNQDVFIGIGFAVPITVAGGAAGLPPY